MGISVHETAPESDDQTLTDNAVSTDDDAAEAAAAALATVDSEFGRTTDPVRMYMREMGTVELLTREGELRIAGVSKTACNQVSAALAAFPPTVERLVDRFDEIDREEARLTDVIVGFALPDIGDTIPKPPRPSPMRRKRPMTKMTTMMSPKIPALNLEEVAEKANDAAQAVRQPGNVSWRKAARVDKTQKCCEKTRRGLPRVPPDSGPVHRAHRDACAASSTRSANRNA